MSVYQEFKSQLILFLDGNERKTVAFRHTVRDAICGLVTSEDDRNNKLAEDLQNATELQYNGRLANILKHFKNAKTSTNIEIAYGLYFLAEVNRNYTYALLKIEESLYGSKAKNRITFEIEFGLDPKVEFQKEAQTNAIVADSKDTFRTSIVQEGAKKPPLQHPSPPFDLELPPRSSQIYHYTNHTIEILGRDKERAALRRFRGEQPGFRWWQIAGVSGQGKSRLALDLILNTQRDLPNWQAGFLTGEASDSDSSLNTFADCCVDWSPQRPYLIVVDYVLTRTRLLKKIIQTLAERHEVFDYPVCLLIIERQPWNFGGFNEFVSDRADWFVKLSANSSGHDLALTDRVYCDNKSPEILDILELGALKADQLVEIVVQVSAQQNSLLEVDRNAIKKKITKIDDQGRPLYAFFLGKAIGSDEKEATRDSERLLDWVLQSDRLNRWRDKFKDQSGVPGIGSFAPNHAGHSGQNPSMHLALLATMTGKLNCNDVDFNAEGWAVHNRTILQEALIFADNHVVDDPEPEISGLQPDLLGEWFVLRSIQKQKSFSKLIKLAWQLNPAKSADFILRVTRDFPQHESTKYLLDLLPIIGDGAAYEACKRQATYIFSNLYRTTAPVHDKAIELLQDSANSKNTYAMNSLGVCYFFGNGVPQNFDRAIKWFKKGIEEGSGDAMRNLGGCYFYGDGVPKDVYRALELFKDAESNGSCYATVNLGFCYKYGYGVPLDVKKALKWFHKGVDAGNSNAMNNIGDCHQYGIGVQQNIEQALEWYGKGAAEDCGNAMNSLGDCFQFGKGVAPNIEQALELYRKGAASYSGDAMNSLGDCYQYGKGVPQNIEQAVDWYQESAKLGSESACDKLALLSK